MTCAGTGTWILKGAARQFVFIDNRHAALRDDSFKGGKSC